MDMLKTLLETGIPSAIWAFMLYRLGLHLLKKFQTPLEQVAQRLKRIGPAEFEPALTQKTGTVLELSTSTPPAELSAQDHSLLGEYQSAINQWLLQFPEDRRQSELVGSLVRWQIGWMFEVINSLIFGSQIALLQELNSQPVSIMQTRELYEEVALSFPDFYRSYSFDGWLSWVRDTARLVIQPDNDTLMLSELGREFLKYLVHRGYSFNRPG